MEAIEKIIQAAKDELGYLEKKSSAQLDHKTANAGSKNYTKYARDLDAMDVFDGKKNGYAWCAVFVTWLFVKTFELETALKMLAQYQGGYGASCTWAVGRYKAVRRFFNDPQIGDQIFFTSDGGKSCNHTGIVVDIKGGKVYTIEGNTSGASGVVANGGCVCAKSYALTYKKIYGYGRPDWPLAQEKEETAVNDKTGIPTPTEPADWAKAAWEKARAAGVLDGTRPTESLTRQELAVVLDRLGLLEGGGV